MFSSVPRPKIAGAVTLLGVALLAALGTVVPAGPASAAARVAPSLFSARLSSAAPSAANAAQPAITSCPASNAVCFYNSDNFKNLLGDAEPSSCNIPRAPLPDALRNVINSIRNRTKCVIRLWYFCGTSVCLGEKMIPESEDGEISPVNALDEISFSTS